MFADVTKSNGRRDNGIFVAQGRVRYLSQKEKYYIHTFVAQGRVRYATKGKRQKLYTKSSVARHQKKCQPFEVPKGIRVDLRIN